MTDDQWRRFCEAHNERLRAYLELRKAEHRIERITNRIAWFGGLEEPWVRERREFLKQHA